MSPKLKAKAKVWIEADGAYFMGNGRAELLAAIDRCGSISEAARRLDISYRHAWGYINKIESRLGMKIVETTKGGKGGGHAELTAAGRKLLDDYAAFRRAVDKAIADSLKLHFRKRKIARRKRRKGP